MIVRVRSPLLVSGSMMTGTMVSIFPPSETPEASSIVSERNTLAPVPPMP